jgi:membrane associated rhomboid family serine protease
MTVKETHLSRSPARGSLWVALSGVFVLLLVSVIYWFDIRGLASYLPAIPERVFRHSEYWRLLTSIGAHTDFRHFLSNGIVFGVLSFLLYGYFGAVVYPALTWGLGCLVTAVSLSTYSPNTRLLGASGVVYLMAGFWLTSYLFIERRLGIGKRRLRAIGFGLIVLVPTVWEPSVSYRTHGIGFGVGVLFAVAYFSQKKDELRKAERVEMDY